MHKQFYCPVDKCKTMFVEHSDHKGIWVCSSCRYTTSHPREEIKMPQPKKSDMDSFWDKMAAKSRGEKPISIRSR